MVDSNFGLFTISLDFLIKSFTQFPPPELSSLLEGITILIIIVIEVVVAIILALAILGMLIFIPCFLVYTVWRLASVAWEWLDRRAQKQQIKQE